MINRQTRGTRQQPLELQLSKLLVRPKIIKIIFKAHILLFTPSCNWIEDFDPCFRTFLLGIVALLSVNVTYLWQQIIAASLALHSGHQQRATTPELCATNSDTGCPMCTARTGQTFSQWFQRAKQNSKSFLMIYFHFSVFPFRIQFIFNEFLSFMGRCYRRQNKQEFKWK